MGIFDRWKKHADDDRATTPGGDPLYVHDDIRAYDEVAAIDADRVQLRDAHLARFVGDDWTVLHEIASVGIHLDVYVVPPKGDRDVYLLVTSGMSDRPMAMPPGAEDGRFAELMLALPPYWAGLELDDSADTADRGPLSDERNYWPIRPLKGLARLPHDYETFLSWGHSIPNGDPAEPYAPGVPFTGALIGPPLGLDPDIFELQTPDGPIFYYAVLPLTDAEMELKISTPEGGSLLIDRMIDEDLTMVVDPDRPELA